MTTIHSPYAAPLAALLVAALGAIVGGPDSAAAPPRFSFAAPVASGVSVWGGPQPEGSFRTGDFDADGRLDVLVQSKVRLATTYGRFATTSGSLTTSDAMQAVVDLDGDGHLDVAGAFLSTIRIAFGLGDGTFTAEVDYPIAIGFLPSVLAPADFDSDLRPDVAAYSSQGKVQVLRNTASGFVPSAVFTLPAGSGWLDVGDFDGDGVADLLVANTDLGLLIWLRGLGNATFDPPAQLVLPGRPLHIAVADLDADGRQDAVVARRDTNQVTVFRGSPTGMIQGATYAAATRPRQCLLADFTGDAKLDLYTVTEVGADIVRAGTGTGSFGSPIAVDVGSASWVAATHTDADGILDLVAYCGYMFTGQYPDLQSSLQCYAGLGNGTFRVPPTKGSVTAPFQPENPVALIDTDGDGRLDLVLGDAAAGKLRVEKNLGGGAFAAPVFSSSFGSVIPSYVLRGDFEPDGLEDLVYVEYTGRCDAHRSLGEGSYAHAGTFAGLPGMNTLVTPSPALADLDSDGSADLLLGDSFALYASTWQGASQSFAPPTIAAMTFSQLGSTTMDDFDVDGDLDCILVNDTAMGPGGNDFKLYLFSRLGTGALGFTVGPQTSLPQVGNPGSHGGFARDFDQDGLPDILLSKGGMVHVLRGLGTGGFALQQTTTVSLGASLAFADLDGDLADDLFTPTGTLVPGLGGFAFDFAGAEEVGTVGAPFAMAAGDLSGDGRNDLAVSTFGGQTSTRVNILIASCTGRADRYGDGCPGSGGYVPELSLTGCPASSQPVALAVKKGLGGAMALLVFGGGEAALPVGGGCTLLAAPLLPVTLALPLAGAGAGNGGVTVNTVVPPGTPVVEFTMQAFVADGASPIGFAAANAARVLLR